jgi:hypothetical protein
VARIETVCRPGEGEAECNGLDDDCSGAIDDACTEGRPSLQIAAAWTADADLDLIVTGPSGTPLARDGGRDIGCEPSDLPARVERADYHQPGPGAYRVELVRGRPCSEDPTPAVASISVAAFGEDKGVFNTTLPPDTDRTFVLAFNLQSPP